MGEILPYAAVDVSDNESLLESTEYEKIFFQILRVFLAHGEVSVPDNDPLSENTLNETNAESEKIFSQILSEFGNYGASAANDAFSIKMTHLISTGFHELDEFPLKYARFRRIFFADQLIKLRRYKVNLEENLKFLESLITDMDINEKMAGFNEKITLIALFFIIILVILVY